VWVVIGEVPDGNWGAGGNVVRFEQLRQAAAAERAGAGAATAIGGAAAATGAGAAAAVGGPA
jgi:hypothetical protein